MKIAKALKLKNQLAGEVAQLKELLAKQNVRSTKQKFDYDNREVLVGLRAKVDELVKVKASIAAANAEIYNKIFRLAESKGLVATLTALDTKTGVFHEGGRFGEAGYEVEYAAQLSKVEVDKLIAQKASLSLFKAQEAIRKAQAFLMAGSSADRSGCALFHHWMV